MYRLKVFFWVIAGLGVGLLSAVLLVQSGILPLNISTAQSSSETLSNVIYLIGDTPPQRSIAPVERIQTSLNATIATNWQQVLQSSENRAIEALVIEHDARELVDQAWLANAYANGVAIAGINFAPEEFSQLLGGNCLNVSSLARYEEDSYIITSYHIRGADPTDVALVASQFAATCGEWNEQNLPAPTTTVRLNTHISTDTLTNEEQITTFARSLAIHVNPPETAP